MRVILALLLSIFAGQALAQQTSPLSIAKGGTAGATAAAARTNLGVTATGADTTYAFRANNLSDLANASTARTNLGLAIGSNVEAWNALLDCFSGLGSTGIVRRTGAGTCSAGTTVANSELATATANTLKGNATGGTAAPTDIAIPSCSGANQAINWTSGTGPGCATIAGSGGAWTNTRLAKTAAYTTVTGDCGATLALSGAAYYAAIFNAPSGYAVGCAFLVLNEDTARGKMLLPQFASSATSTLIGTGSKAFTTSAGLNIVAGQRYRVYSLANTANWMSGTATYASTTLTLTADSIGGSGTFTDWQIAPEIRIWPGQTRWIFNQNNVWTLSPFERWIAPANITFFTDTAGSDGNDCLVSGAGACRNICPTVALAEASVDYAYLYNPLVKPTAGQTWTEVCSISGTPMNANSNVLYLQGNGGAFTWASSGSNSQLSFGDGAIGIVQDIAFTSSRNVVGKAALYLHNNAIVDTNSGLSFAGGGNQDNAIYLDNFGCIITISNTITLTGSLGSALRLENGGRASVSGAFTPSGSPSMNQLIVARNNAVVNSAIAHPSAGWTSIGASYVDLDALINLNGTTLPGGAVFTATGGKTYP